MLITNPLVLTHLPSLMQTFGASSVVFAPVFNLLLIAAAILILIALLKSNFVRNIFAGLGFLGLMNYFFSNQDSSPSSRNHGYSQEVYRHGHGGQPPYNIHTHQSEQRSFFNVHGHPSQQNPSYSRGIHGYG